MIFTIIRIVKRKNIKSLYLGYSKIEAIQITFLLFIKPLKIFKIINKKQNKVLEDFYAYIIDNNDSKESNSERFSLLFKEFIKFHSSYPKAFEFFNIDIYSNEEYFKRKMRLN